MLIYSITTLLLVVCLLDMTQATLSPEERRFICQYDGLPGFPCPCANAIYACSYRGITCKTVFNATWNETIIDLKLAVSFSTNSTTIIPTEIGYLTSLQSFYSTSTSFVTSLYQSSIPTEIGLCTNLISITLFLPLGGTLPVELFLGASQLTFIKLVGSQISGTIPDALSTLTQLTQIRLQSNRFSGTFPSITSLTRLQILDIGSNQLSGNLPDANLLTQLTKYDVGYNQFKGNVPVFNSSTLAYVDISRNLLDGTLSSIIYAPNTVPSLLFAANANQLIGTIPSQLFGAPLVTLDLSHNRLSGTLPSEIMLSLSLEQLVLSHNELSGTLHSAFNNFLMPSMFRLSLDHNKLTGLIPTLILGAVPNVSAFAGASHVYLNMNDNAFSGPLPYFPNFPLTASLDFSNNALTLRSDSLGQGGNISWLNLASNPLGTLPDLLLAGDIFRFADLVSLDLSYCQLSGTLPEFFHVQYLALNNNFFTGDIPLYFNFVYKPTLTPEFIDVRLNRLNKDATRISRLGTVLIGSVFDIVLTDFPQDVDECALGISECEYLCVDGWFPIPGYTCACPSGYELNILNKRNCTAVCGDGLLRYPEEQCDYEYSLLGCYHNCTTKPGYKCDATGCNAICGDGLIMPPEECDNTGSGCSTQCTAMLGYTCSLESNICQSCAQSWIPFIYPPNLELFPKLREIIGDLSVFDFTACVACTDGYALQTRTILAENQCLNMSAQRSLPCSFACSNLTVFRSASDAIFTLKSELMRGDFIARLFHTLFNVNVTLNITLTTTSKKRGTTNNIATLQFNLSPCTVDTSGMITMLNALTQDIVPNLPLLQLAPSECGFIIQGTDIIQQIYISTVIVVCVAAILGLLALIGILYYYYRQSELHSLPKDISWSFIDQWTHPWRWEYHGSSKSGYYARIYEKSSEEYRRVDSLLTTHFKKGPLRVVAITAVYNPALSVSFVNQWKLMTTRRIEAPEQFFRCTFNKDEEKVQIMKYYQDNLLQFTPYNQKLCVPLLPALHGTDLLVAEKIAQTGFASLSSLDPGFFGRGIYFTTSLPYTLPYSCGKRKPSVIISYVNMGNIFPVTEDHKSHEKSLKGQALKAGYNSHLVLTNKDGFIYKEQNGGGLVCDEIVVNQESQILPAFIIELDLESCQTEYDKWVRDIPLPMNNAALQNFNMQVSPTSDSTRDTILSIVSMDGM